MRKQQSGIPPGCLPFLISAMVYLAFGSVSRVTVGQLPWVMVTLVAVPGLAGWLIARRGQSNAQAVFGALFWAMTFYTLVNLIRIRTRIGSGDTGGNLLAILLVTLVQSAVAGGVAAGAATLRAGVRPREVQK